MEKKRCTITTIARELGIAPSTVSRAFDPGSRISDEARRRNYCYIARFNWSVFY